MKNVLTRCQRPLLSMAAAAVLAGGPTPVGAAADTLHHNAGDLLRRAEAQHHEIATLQRRLQSGPLSWPAWWGLVGAAAGLAWVTLVPKRRRWSSSVPSADFDAAPPLRAPLPQLATEPEPLEAPQVAVPPADPSPPVLPPHATPDLSARADALLTTAGEVEFLASIGLHHGAVEVLEQHLSATACAAPLAWLELVNLHRSQGDGGPATSVWHRLVTHFPPAAWSDAEALLDDTEGLEAFPAVLARVHAAWGTPLAAEQLATELMAWESPLLTLSAARDLLWLLRICHERTATRPAPAPVGDAFERTVVLSAADWVRHLEAMDVTPRDQAAAVDIDLGVPGWIEEAKASVRLAEPALVTQEAATTTSAKLDQVRIDLFDAATGFERLRPAVSLDVISR